MRVLSTVYLLLLTVLISCETESTVFENKDTLFEKIEAERSGIQFRNEFTSKDSINILDFNIIHDGGGVAVGDVNNDGRTDLYFTANQTDNKLYLNNGDFTFTDITKTAGVEGTADWSKGTTMVDINGDGFIDIYTTAISGYGQLAGANELFINNGDSTFTEQSQMYGLDISGFSNHVAFFDYDQDGDLDCYILKISLRTAHGRIPNAAIRNSIDKQAGDMLLRNDGGSFVDVSQEAGIHQGPTGFGLGIAVADFNNDNWEDIYISNDFFEDDYLYINNRDGTFTEFGRQYFKHMTQASMGNDAADYNNDGFIDLVTLDMLPEDEYTEKTIVGEDPQEMKDFKQDRGYYHQIARNAFQLNNAGKSFSDVAPLFGVEATDWSWAPLLADFNLDGVKDLYVSNGIPKRANSLSYVKFYQDAVNSRRGNVDLDEFYRESIEQMPEGESTDYLFEGSEKLVFKNKTTEWGIKEPSYSNGAAYADLDNDGDLEIIINRLFDSPVIYKNRTLEQGDHNYLKVKLNGFVGNPNGIGAKVFLYENGKMQLQQNMPSRGFLSSVDPRINFGLNSLSGKIDSLRVVWDHQYQQLLTEVEPNQTITINKEEAAPENNKEFSRPDELFVQESIVNHKHEENSFSDFRREPLMPFKASREGPALAVGDVNNDGFEDMFVGGAKLQPAALWLQQQGGSFIKSDQDIFEDHHVYEDVDALIFDADGDGFQDLYVVSGGNEFYGEMEQQFDRLYMNDGKGNFQYDPDRLPEMFDNKSAVAASDFDKDGDIDLFSGGRVVGYNYGKIPSSYLLINDGKGFFEDKTEQFSDDLRKTGMVTDAAWADIDGDDIQDLVVVGEFMPVSVYINKGNSLELTVISDESSDLTTSGLWQSVEVFDLDQDGDLDILAGNLGMNNIFDKPNGYGKLKMFVNDFEENGLTDQILTYDREGKWYPIHKFEDLKSVIPAALENISDHTDYAGQPITEIIDESKLSKSEVRTAERLESVFIENNGDGTFSVMPLPVQAQQAPIFGFQIEDFNQDGLPDILAGGNKYGVSIRQGRYDASIGSLLINRDNGSFDSINPELAGISLDGEIRKIEKISIKSSLYIVAARNNKEIQFFRHSVKSNCLTQDVSKSRVSIRDE
ncbi:MAG: RNA-binding protein [Bacteroidetes bacterium]|jgi:hypothetical protein|nr:RNA-binding protein [Bacteroidota bacterium]